MARRKWILILTVFVTISQQIHATCVCNEKGTDSCSCAGPVKPRPKQVRRPEFQLPPVGDNCWCSKTMIEPASLPKPNAKHKKHPTSGGCQGVMLPPSYIVPQVNYQQAYDVKDNSPPADPISISLAVQAGKAIQVPEAKLAYGFVRKPLNSVPKVYISSIKEENLYALANDVITLKRPLTTKSKKLEEDYPEPEEDEEEEPDSEEYEPPSLTYKQLGYGPDDFQNPAFIPMPAPDQVAQAAASLLDDAKEGVSSDCGFKPGSITKIKQHKKFRPINCLMRTYSC